MSSMAEVRKFKRELSPDSKTPAPSVSRPRLNTEDDSEYVPTTLEGGNVEASINKDCETPVKAEPSDQHLNDFIGSSERNELHAATVKSEHESDTETAPLVDRQYVIRARPKRAHSDVVPVKTEPTDNQLNQDDHAAPQLGTSNSRDEDAALDERQAAQFRKALAPFNARMNSQETSNHLDAGPLFFIECAPYATRGAGCQLISCRREIEPRSYRICVHSTKWSTKYYHVACFEKLVDMNDIDYISRFVPLDAGRSWVRGLNGIQIADQQYRLGICAWELVAQVLMLHAKFASPPIDRELQDVGCGPSANKDILRMISMGSWNMIKSYGLSVKDIQSFDQIPSLSDTLSTLDLDFELACSDNDDKLDPSERKRKANMSAEKRKVLRGFYGKD